MRNLLIMENNRTGRNARAIGPYSRAVGRAVAAMLAENGLKVVDMLNDERFTSNIYAMLKGDSVITVDDLRSMADFLGVEPSAIITRATGIATSMAADELAGRRQRKHSPQRKLGAPLKKASSKDRHKGRPGS